MSLTALPAGPEHADGLAELFSRTGSPCHCRWWHFTGDKNAWLDRCANDPARNQREMLAALTARSAEMRGIVALDATGRVVGWMKLAPAIAVPKLYAQRLYKGLPCFDGDRSGVFTVGCFLVDESVRKTGVAHALLAAGIELARSLGGTAVEAFPRVAPDVEGEHLWTGPEGVFRRAGFERVHDLAQYPVLRKSLGAGDP